MRTSVVAVVLACSFALAGCTTEHAVSHRREMGRRENDSLAAVVKRDVVRMKNAGIGDEVIINLLRASGSFFPMYASDVVELADSGVSDSVINAMIQGSSVGARGRAPRPLPYYSPYYGDWSYPYWYPWDPFYSAALSVGYYRPYYGYGFYAPYNHFGWGGAGAGPSGFRGAPRIHRRR